MSGTAEKINSGIVAYGRTKTYIGTALGSVVFLSFIVVGIYMINTSIKNKNKIKSIQAKIVDIKSETNYNSRNRSVSYRTNISYKVDDKDYTSTITLNNYQPIDSFVTVYYDINDPNNVSTTSNTTTGLIGGGMVSCALLLCILMFVNTYFVSKSDIAALDVATTSLVPRIF
jgi:hypothetical protein